MYDRRSTPSVAIPEEQAYQRTRSTWGTEQMPTRKTKKVFVRASRTTGRTYVSGVAVEAVVAQLFIDLLKQRCPKLPAAEQALLEQLFYVGGTDRYTALLPADDHPERRLRAWQPFYELELDAAQTYASRFYQDTRFARVAGFPRLRRGDDVVLIGSQVANAAARALLGRPDHAAPQFRVARSGWRTDLHWNLHTPESAPRTTIAEFRGQRTSLAHVFCERESAACYSSRRDPAGTRYLDDYLLVTMLPRRKGSAQRTLILSGLHGPGTRAIDLILREPPTAMLEQAARQIDGAPYFQMLWHLDTTPDRRGECFPCGPELIEARALSVEPSRS
jgi:hypothetical protein